LDLISEIASDCASMSSELFELLLRISLDSTRLHSPGLVRLPAPPLTSLYYAGSSYYSQPGALLGVAASALE
jgi:hypothetical protein